MKLYMGQTEHKHVGGFKLGDERVGERDRRARAALRQAELDRRELRRYVRHRPGGQVALDDRHVRMGGGEPG